LWLRTALLAAETVVARPLGTVRATIEAVLGLLGALTAQAPKLRSRVSPT
jgi:hypothetical protein